jgi:hypothetical protein
MIKQDSNTTSDTIQEVPRGDRSAVGEATTALTIKQRWHEATHVLANVGDHSNPRKQKYVRKAGAPSLKQFARKLLLAKDELAIKWFAGKRGGNNQPRTKENIAKSMLACSATKASRHKREKTN